MNKTKGVARIFGRGGATKLLLSPKNNKIRSPLFLIFLYAFCAFIGFRRPLELFIPPYIYFHQHRMLIWPTYHTFLQQMRRHKAQLIDLRQGRSPYWRLGGEAPGKFSRFYVNFTLREHTCQWHCYTKSYFFVNRLEAKCPLPFHLTFM